MIISYLIIITKGVKNLHVGSMLSLRKSKDTYLDKIDKIIDWGRIKRILDNKYKWIKNSADNPAYPPVT